MTLNFTQILLNLLLRHFVSFCGPRPLFSNTFEFKTPGLDQKISSFYDYLIIQSSYNFWDGCLRSNILRPTRFLDIKAKKPGEGVLRPNGNLVIKAENPGGGY